MSKLTFCLLAALLLMGLAGCRSGEIHTLTSPAGTIAVYFFLADDGSPRYLVKQAEKVVIDTSALGFDFQGQPALRSGLKITGVETNTANEDWELPWGEQRMVNNHYNELLVSLTEQQEPGRSWHIRFRAYDDGIGFRHEFPEQPGVDSVIILDEHTEFRLTDDHTTWWMPGDWDSYEHLYNTTAFSKIDALAKADTTLAQSRIPENAVNTPVTMRTQDGLHLSFHEANLTDYADMTLRIDPARLSMTSELVGSDRLGYKVKRALPFVTPWRTIQISEDAAGLIASNLILNLNEPNRLGDAGYVGPILPKGEYHHGQWMVQHYRRVLETAARHQVAVNAHEPIKDTGIRRTLPNAIAREGLRGQEFNAWASDGGNPPEHLPIVAFTRMLAGPIDFTPGIFDIKLSRKVGPKNQVNTTLAQQLALYVVIYSPIQMAADLPEHYEGHPAFQFVRDVGVDWERTEVLNGEVGDFVTIARQERGTGHWFVGSITDGNAREISVDFGFLEPGFEYEAVVYQDGPDAHWDDNPTSIEIEPGVIKNGEERTFRLAPGGGVAISLKKK